MKLGRLTILVLLLLAMPAWADGPQTGTIDGQVRDAQGQGLPGVTVTLKGPQGDQTTTTGGDGGYRFALLPAGRYTVGASLEGLGSDERATDLASGSRRAVDFKLGGNTAETITVVSEAPLISKYETGSNSTLGSEVAEKLTFGTRNYSSSVRQLPGVVSTSDSDVTPAVNGGTPADTATFVEGVDTSMNRRGGELRLFIPTTSVMETRLESAGFGAEYGRAISGIIATTIKTGTNQFHGEGLFIAQNTKWRSAYKEVDLPRPDDSINSYEANIGGPIVRDKAWFFASYAKQSDNQLDSLPDDSVINVSRESTPSILKVNFQPSTKHQITLTGIDSPTNAIFVPAQNPGDIYGLTLTPVNGEIYTGTWSFAATSAVFLEVKASTRSEYVGRDLNVSHALTPGASPDTPLGNNFRYLDLASGLRYNAAATPLGNGFNDFPRDQANGSVTVFEGDHELKFGVDYQDLEFRNQTIVGQEYRGRGYNPALPGGYTTPQNKRVFAPSGVITSSTKMTSGFAQDRFNLSDRWNLYYGLRADHQTVNNDIGEDVDTYTKWAPRLSAVYDIHGDGKLLARATAGRYYRNIALDIATAEFGRLPSGVNQYDVFNWNAATQRYDRFSTTVTPRQNEIQQVDPYYKDELSAGVDWQFKKSWVLTSRVVWHQIDDLFWASDQFDAAGQVVRDVRNWNTGDNVGSRKYKALALEVNRSFRDGWSVRTNYTLSKAEGNYDNNGTNDDLFEGLSGVQTGTGATNATSVNRYGRLGFDTTHNLNLVGVKRWSIGSQDVGVGAYFGYRSGNPYGIRPSATVTSPISGQSITTTTYIEPRDARTAPDNFNLNLTGDWSFPIASKVRGSVGVELANITDEQEVVNINLTTGTPIPGIGAYQLPRELRVKVGVSF